MPVRGWGDGPHGSGRASGTSGTVTTGFGPLGDGPHGSGQASGPSGTVTVGFGPLGDGPRGSGRASGPSGTVPSGVAGSRAPQGWSLPGGSSCF